ncbi:O-methyltransferase [Apiospora rasikravindrae]|uniref:O-methyltransferase n=1 Tax=Apiospora rasikravindrae TaxID=990691 RepID=A0ABR1SDB2_9PEZI
MSQNKPLHAANNLTVFFEENIGGDWPESARVSALAAARDLVAVLEKPQDALLRFAQSPVTWLAMRTCVQLGVFPMVSETGVSAAEIAQNTGADELLIRRLLRTLTASGFVAEKGDGLYGATPYTKQLSERTTIGTIEFLFDFYMPMQGKALGFLQETKYQNPSDPKHGILQHTYQTDKEAFPFLLLPENKGLFDKAQTFFEGDRGSRPSWVEWFPVQEKLIRGYDTQAPLLVDVAGGRGHDVTEFHQKFPHVTGKLILQDQQPVLDTATELPACIEKAPIDFFKDIPIKCARIYFMKFVMHDYSDEDCLRILQNVKPAMTRDYSYLVINDFILPDVGCSLLAAQWDLMMMLSMSGLERTESQWKSLMGVAGLEVEGLYQPPGDGQGVILARL